MPSTTYTPAEVFPAGDYLRDELEERGWTVTEFAEIIGRPLQAVSEILNGKKEITTDTAIEFADALGTSPELWLNLQTNYRVWLQRQQRSDESPVARRARLREVVPLSEVRSRGWIAPSDDLDRTEAEVCSLLEISAVTETPRFLIAARRANHGDRLTIAQQAWIGRVRQIARPVAVNQFDARRLESCAENVARRLRGGPPLLGDVPSWFAEVGVVIVYLRGLRGGKLDGAVTILETGSPVIGLTARGDRFDTLVFTLLHECAHLTLGHVSVAGDAGLLVDEDVTGPTDDPNEVAANDQASAWIFPDGFDVSGTSAAALIDAAGRYRVHPSLVIGRVQHDRGDYRIHRSHVAKVRAHLFEEGRP
jgi:HTH-type transcriptional regulator/antitoxin HigA